MKDIDPDTPRSLQGFERPFWQTSPCAKWCYMQHSDSDLIEDRFHFGATAGVDLSLEAPHTVGPDQDQVVPKRLDADLYQGYRETEPHVTFGLRDGSFGVRITLREAEDIAHMLIHITEVARGEAKPGEEID